MITRRYFMRACGAAAFASESLPFTLAAQLQGNLNDDSVTENQRGDPDIPDEYVTFSPSAIEHIVSKSRKATFEQWDRNLPLTMLVTARNFIGYNRKDNPEQISKFLDLFDLPIATGAGVVPFCAAGLSYCALTAYARKLSGISDQAPTRERLRKLMPDVEHYYFYPTVSCVDLYHIAAGKRRWVPHTPGSARPPKPGWLVLYDWNKRGIPDHCGLVQQPGRDFIKTVEFNTSSGEGSQKNGGTVAEKTRSYEYVLGFVITDSVA